MVYLGEVHQTKSPLSNRWRYEPRMGSVHRIVRKAIQLRRYRRLPNEVRHHRVILEDREDDLLLRGSAEGFLGLAYWTSGDLEAAHWSYAECMARVTYIDS